MKYIVAVSVLFFAFYFNAFSQSEDKLFEYTKTVKINPIDFGKSEFQVAYEHYFNDRKMSIVLMPSIILSENNMESENGWQGMLQYRFYLTHFNKDKQNTFLGIYNYGFYAAGYGLYLDYNEKFIRGVYNPSNFEYENKVFERDINAFEGGAVLGLQFDITKRIIVDFYLGGGVRKSDETNSYTEVEEFPVNYGIFDRAYTGVKPKAGLLVGITF